MPLVRPVIVPNRISTGDPGQRPSRDRTVRSSSRTSDSKPDAAPGHPIPCRFMLEALRVACVGALVLVDRTRGNRQNDRDEPVILDVAVKARFLADLPGQEGARCGIHLYRNGRARG